MPTDDEVTAKVIEELGTEARPLLDLLDRLEARRGGRLDLGQVEAVINEDPAFVVVEDHDSAADDHETTEIVYHLPTRAEGLCLTFLLDPEDAANQLVPIDPWLSPLGWWLNGGEAPILVGDQPIDTWTEQRLVGDTLVDVVVGPDHWLDNLAGRSVSATVTAAGLCLSPLDCPVVIDSAGIDADLTNAIADGFARTARITTAEPLLGEGPVDLLLTELSEPFRHALATDRAIVGRPLPPIPDLYQAAGLETKGFQVARSGFDWSVLEEWRRRQETRWRHGLDGDDVDALTLVIGAALSVIDGIDDALGADEDERTGAAILIAGLLERGQVATAFWSEMTTRGRTGDLKPFITELERRLEGVAIVGPTWLLARGLEEQRRSAEAAEILEAVAGGRSTHTPALLDLAGYAADRSEIATAAELVRRADIDPDGHEVEDHHRWLLEEVAGYRRVEATTAVGRNQPCPCGSGRKFKACHLRSGYVTLENRAGWLADKMRRHAIRHGATTLAEVADALAGGDEIAGVTLQDSHLTLDLALWEGKLVDGFVESKRDLLPPDEAALLDGWRAARRTILRVTELDGGRVTLDDLVRGGRRVVGNVVNQGRLSKGVTFLARPVPVGDAERLLFPLVPLDDDGVEALGPAVQSSDLFELATMLETILGPGRHQALA